MHIREAKQKDFDYMKFHSCSGSPFKDQPEQIDYIFAAEHDLHLLGIGAFKMLNKYTAFVWMDWTEFAHKNKVMSFRAVKEWTEDWLKDKDIKRLMAVVDPDFDAAIRTTKRLGFHQESIMPFYYGDKPGLLFARYL